MTDKHEYVLQVEDMNFHYPHAKKNTLEQVSFSIKANSLCGLLGPNGSGKSTLFRCCMNFLKPQQGSIKLNNEDISTLSPKKLAKLISYVPQEHKQPFPFLVEDMVLMGRTSRMASSLNVDKVDIFKANQAMERVGIRHLHHIPFNQLSGGQRQLVLIARALAQESSLMLLDEPSSALDFSNQVLLWKLLKELTSDGITILVCSHDPNYILWFCSELIAMKEGKVLTQAHPNSLINGDVFSQLYDIEFDTLKHNDTFMIFPPRA